MSENQSSSSKLKIVMDKLENNALQNVKQLQKNEGIIPNGNHLISLHLRTFKMPIILI